MIDVLFCSLMDFADRFLGRRIDGFESLAILALDELIVDEAASTRVSLWPGTLGGDRDTSLCYVKCGVNAR